MKANLKPLFIDCQTTGASPKTSSLLEVGWNERSWVLCQPTPVSPKVLKLVGIGMSEVECGISREDLWGLLSKDLESSRPEYAVAHFARFEKVYLDQLWHEFSGKNFPVPLLCTHQIARRLFPKLPSYGLRALAGWFGTPLPHGKRAASHVSATKIIWECLRAELENRGIETLEDIQIFCAAKVVKSSGAREFLIPKDKRLGLPQQPGVYRYLDRTGRVLYVGKATSLKQRVNSYFTGGCRGDHRKLEMLAQAVDLEITPVETPLDAGLLEFDEIRRFNPPYNIAFKGDFQNPIHGLILLTKTQHDFSRPDISRLVRTHFHGLTDSQVLDEGLRLWRQSMGLALTEEASVRTLLKMGLPLVKAWIEAERIRIQEEALARSSVESLQTIEARDDIGEEAEDVETPDFIWTAELIALACSSILRRATRHYLRLKWWRRIASSTIAFVPASSKSLGNTTPPNASRILEPRPEGFDAEDPRRIKLLVHELRRAEAKGGTWSIVAPWPMNVPFWI